jgi:hypothetical protein
MDGIQLHGLQCYPFDEHNVQIAMLQVMVHIAAGVLTSTLLKTLACRQSGASVFRFWQNPPSQCGLADLSMEYLHGQC